MKIRSDKYFNVFRLNIPDSVYIELATTVAIDYDLCALFVKAGMLQDGPDSYGATMGELLGDKSPSDVCAVIAPYVRIPVTIEMLTDFLRLTVMGDGFCPHCGGDLHFVETEGHDIPDGNYEIPNTHIIDKYIYRCAICGETIESDIEL